MAGRERVWRGEYVEVFIEEQGFLSGRSDGLGSVLSRSLGGFGGRVSRAFPGEVSLVTSELCACQRLYIRRKRSLELVVFLVQAGLQHGGSRGRVVCTVEAG